MTDDEYRKERKRLQDITGRSWARACGGVEVTDENRDELTARYLEELKTLSTEDLESVLAGHKNKIVYRREDTLTVIKNELFDRGIFIAE